MGKLSLDNILWCISLSLIFTYGLMYRIIDPRMAVLFIIPICVIWLLKRRLTPFDLPFVFLFAGMNYYALHEYRVDPMLRLEYTELVYFWIFPIVYVFGKLIIGENKASIAKRSHVAIFVLGIGMYIQAMLDYWAQYNIPTDAFGHVWLSFWNHIEINSRNIYDLNFLVITASLFYLLIERKKQKILLAFATVAEIIALYFNIINRGRTNIVVLALVMFVMTIVYCASNWATFTKNQKRLFEVAGASFVLAVTGFSALISMGKIEAGLDENDKFLARGGGILNNLRFKMAREGLQKAFTYGKGGWEVLSGDNNTTHNTFLEYARVGDIIISILIFLFAVTSMVIAFRMLIKFNQTNPVLYLIVGVQMAFFSYFFVEPSGFAQKKLFVLYIFITGISMGYYDVLLSSDYSFIKRKPTKTYNNIATLLLGYSMINMVYIDYYCDRMSIAILLIPIIVYLLGEKVKRRGLALVIASIICLALAFATWLISMDSEYYPAGFVFEFFTRIVVEKTLLFGLMILPAACFIGYILYKMKINKWIAILISFVLVGIYYYPRFRDGRLHNIKEALSLWLKKPWGSFTVTSSLTLSSHDMWLDYARDYGIVVAVPLLLFAIICFIRFIKLANSKERNSWIDYTLLISFVLFNCFFALEAIPYNHKYLFYIALFTWGMTSPASAGVFLSKADQTLVSYDII